MSCFDAGRPALARTLLLAVPLFTATCAPALAQIQTKSEKFVLAGRTIQLGYYYSMQVDCTPNPIPDIVVVKQPALGRLRIDKTALHPAYAADNVRSVCNGKRTPTRRINYTASPGGKGEDEVVIEIYWNSGRKDVVTFLVHVN